MTPDANMLSADEPEQARTEEALMDIIILALLFVTVILVLRAASRKLILTFWILSLILMLGLFRYHVTSALDLSF